MKPFARVMLTNDDGIDAPGIELLESVAKNLADEVWVIAPAADQSGASQKISLHLPVHCLRRDQHHIAVEGTPVDCVGLGLAHFMAQTPPDVVLCGINAGSNIGDEVNLSGTLGAAAMAQTMGFTSFALSQRSTGSEDKRNFPWETARALAPAVLRHLASLKLPKASCVSVNFPGCAPAKANGLRWVSQGTGNLEGVRVTPCPHPRKLETYWLTIVHLDGQTGDAPVDTARIDTGDITASLIGPNRSLPTALPFTPLADLAHG